VASLPPLPDIPRGSLVIVEGRAWEPSWWPRTARGAGQVVDVTLPEEK
jgi:hypothetical protein